MMTLAAIPGMTRSSGPRLVETGEDGEDRSQLEDRFSWGVLEEPPARGDPEAPLRWSCKSLGRLRAELKSRGFEVSQRVVGDLLREAVSAFRGMEDGRGEAEGAHGRKVIEIVRQCG